MSLCLVKKKSICWILTWMLERKKYMQSDCRHEKKKGLFYVLCITHQSCHLTSNVFILLIMYSFNLLCFSLWSFFRRLQIFSLRPPVWTEAPRALHVLVCDENMKKMKRLTRASRAKLSAACHGILFKKTAFFLINLQRNLTSPQPARWRTETRLAVCSVCMC